MSKKIRVALLWTSMVMALIASSGIANAGASWG
jgi:hypothetical protein